MGIPPLACDSHMHVLGSLARYPGAPTRQYNPTPKPLAEYTRVAARLGLQRVVLVQPSAYGSDNRCLLDTLREQPSGVRAVAVIDPEISDTALAEMHALGVRGVRLNLMSPRVSDVAAVERMLAPVAARVSPFGWHLQIYADPGVVAPIVPVVRRLPVPVVLDHMAGVRASERVDHPDFAALLGLLRSGDCWVKLSGADIVTRRDDDFAAAAPYMRALLDANADRVVWGTDWPHLVHHSGAMGDAAPPAGYRPVDESALLRLLGDCAQDSTTLRRVLVDNPQRLYDF